MGTPGEGEAHEDVLDWDQVEAAANVGDQSRDRRPFKRKQQQMQEKELEEQHCDCRTLL